MKIKKIKINSYGNLADKEINFENKINIIYGKNESGKSTLLNFIINSFYGISKNKKGKEISDYEKYMPWKREDFSGKILYQLDNKTEYELYRDFKKRMPKLYNDSKEDIISMYQIDKSNGSSFFAEQTNIDEDMFKNTLVSMQQEVRIDNQAQSILLQKLANLAGTGEDNVSYKKAIDKLNKRQLEEVGTQRSKDKPINIVNNRIAKLQDNILTINSMEEDLKKIETQKQEYNKEINQKENLNKVIEEVERIKKITNIEENKNEMIKKIIEENKNKIQEFEQEKNNLKDLLNKKSEYFENKKINKKIYIILYTILFIINIINFIILKNKKLNYLFLSLIIILIIINIINLLFNKNKNGKNKLKQENEKNKILNNIQIYDGQIKLLNENNKEQKNKIEVNRKQIENILLQEKNKMLQKYIIEQKQIEELFINNEIEKLSSNIKEKINENKIYLNTINIKEKNIKLELEKKLNIEQELQNLNDKKNELEEKNELFTITKNILEIAYEKMKKTITPKFATNLSETICKISNGKYKKISINDENGIMVELENGEYIPAYRLSTGTIDQLYLSLRLSMASELSKETMPIILDETFAYFDDIRLENILKYIIEQYSNNQIIIFTCTKREKELLEKNNIEYTYITL